jgi:UDP-N-acetylmuramyl pentapeptide synthase
MTSIQDLYTIFLAHPTVCTDTRKLSPNCLFFALKGDNFKEKFVGSLGQAKVFSLFFCKNFGKTRPFLVLGLIAAIHGAILAIKIVFVHVAPFRKTQDGQSKKKQ